MAAGRSFCGAQGTPFAYDLNGNLTSDGSISYSWNPRNQLVGLSGAASASFGYDAVGRRRAKTIAGSTTNLLYDRRNVVEESTSGGTAHLLTGPRIDEIFTRADAAGTSTLLRDGLGSTLELADASGTLQTHYTFAPFGATTTSGAANGNAAQYTARENDGTGLYASRARYYSPKLQRFISEDPIGLNGGWNLYAYTENDPIDFVDPLGLKPSPAPGRPPGPGAGPHDPAPKPPPRPPAPNPPGKGKPGNGPGNQSDNDTSCDPNCISACQNKYVICLSGVAAGLSTLTGSAALTCGLAAVAGGPEAIALCWELMEPGLGIAEDMVAFGGFAACTLAYQIGVASCQVCTP